MKCAEIEESLSAYADGEADAGERLAVCGHLAACAACRRRLRGLAAMKAAVRKVASPRLPEELLAALLREAARQPRVRETFREWLAQRLAPRPLRYGLAGAMAMAAFAILVGISGHGDEDLPLEALLAAHDAYALTMPMADREALYYRLPGGLAAQGVCDEL